jgi:hypothetical protein
MAERKSPHMTITVPSDLRRRMGRTKEAVNWSAVASEAFESVLNSSLPSKLYKYRDTGKFTARIFSKRELYFAAPTSFNDPFDSDFRILCQGKYAKNVIASQAFKSAKKARPEWSDAQALEAAERTSSAILVKHREEASRQLGKSLARDYNDKAGVFCAAANSDDILMWSHYADHHRGICLEFRTNIEDSIFRMAQPVLYRDEYPQLDLRKLVEDEDFREATPWMLTKSSSWSYEREWRILDFENGPGVQIFPPACLSAVILGCCIPEIERKKVIMWVRDFPTPARILQAKKSNTNFRLELADAR